MDPEVSETVRAMTFGLKGTALLVLLLFVCLFVFGGGGGVGGLGLGGLLLLFLLLLLLLKAHHRACTLLRMISDSVSWHCFLFLPATPGQY